MKIGLLTSKSFSEHQTKVLNPIIKDSILNIGVVIIDARPPKSLKQKLKKNFKRGRGAYVIIMAFQRFFEKNKTKGQSVKYFCEEKNIPYIATTKPYSKNTIDQINKYNLDILILMGGFGIIKEPLLSLCPQGILSYHHGNMRKYRGMPPALWELYNGENEMGVTVQKIAAGLDCGIPIVEKTIPIKLSDTLKILKKRAYTASEDMMYHALKKVSNPEFIPTTINEFGEVFTLPNFRQWLMLNIKILFRRFKSFFFLTYL